MIRRIRPYAGLKVVGAKGAVFIDFYDLDMFTPKQITELGRNAGAIVKIKGRRYIALKIREFRDLGKESDGFLFPMSHINEIKSLVKKLIKEASHTKIPMQTVLSFDEDDDPAEYQALGRVRPRGEFRKMDINGVVEIPCPFDKVPSPSVLLEYAEKIGAVVKSDGITYIAVQLSGPWWNIKGQMLITKSGLYNGKALSIFQKHLEQPKLRQIA